MKPITGIRKQMWEKLSEEERSNIPYLLVQQLPAGTRFHYASPKSRGTHYETASHDGSVCQTGDASRAGALAIAGNEGVVYAFMNIKHQQTIGWTLIVVGVGIIILSQKIVFPGLEMLLGIETIVGSENVVRYPDGSYVFTNPGAMMRWIVAVAMVGVAIASGGSWLVFGRRKSGTP